MIAEFAFTPSVFDESANPDAESWREQLRELGNGMFPRTAAWPVMVTDLYAGSWRHVAFETAKAISDDRSRRLCEAILDNITKCLVHRPIGDAAWPQDDFEWAREALASAASEPIDRIVTCRNVQTTLARDGHAVRCIDEVHADGFWNEISSTWEQPLSIHSQVQAIRKLGIHAEFLCLVSPHVRGQSDDETDFAIQLIQHSLARPHGFHAVEIEVHTECPEQNPSADFAERLGRAIRNTSGSLRSVLQPGQMVDLVYWPRLLDRVLLAGVYTNTTGGARVRSPRWGIAMNHIARRADAGANRPPTSWSLLTPGQLGDLFNRYRGDTQVSRPIHREHVVGDR